MFRTHYRGCTYQNLSANTDGYQQVSLSVTPEKTNEIVNYIAFAFVYGYNENEMTVDNAEVNISPLIQSSEDSKNETSEKEARQRCNNLL